jgi:ParB-like chromosome segregation protein Spo0J
MEVAIKDIRVPEGRRALDPVKVAEIAASIKLLGLLAPIGVRRHGEEPVELVWGGHRLAACLSLGMKTITAIAVDGLGWDKGHRENADLDDYVKMAEITENLHRSELTTAQRNEFLAEWVSLVEKRGPQIGAPLRNAKTPGPKPSRAVAEVAKAAGLGTKTVKEAIKSTKVAPEVKAAADDAGLSHKQRLAISRLPEADQLAGVSKQAAINIVADRTEATAEGEAGRCTLYECCRQRRCRALCPRGYRGPDRRRGP